MILTKAVSVLCFGGNQTGMAQKGYCSVDRPEAGLLLSVLEF